MTILGFILALVVAILIHELGHAYAHIRKGGVVKKIMVGFPIWTPPLFVVNKNILGQKVRIEFHILLLGGGMEPDESKPIDDMPYKDKMEILRGGVVANFMTGWAIVLILGAIDMWNQNLLTAISMIMLSILCLYSTFNQGFILKKGKIAEIVNKRLARAWNFSFMFAGFLLFVIIAILIFTEPVTLNEDSGMIGAYKSVDEMYTPQTQALEIEKISLYDKFINSVDFLSKISLVLMILNCIPLFPLDGGRMLQVTIQRYFPGRKKLENIVMGVGILFTIFLTISSLSGDIISIVKSIF